MNEASLTTLHSFILTAIRREGPLVVGVIRSDIRTLTANGVNDLDENRVFRSLDELEEMGLIRKTLGGYVPVYREVQPVKEQKTLFA